MNWTMKVWIALDKILSSTSHDSQMSYFRKKMEISPDDMGSGSCSSIMEKGTEIMERVE